MNNLSKNEIEKYVYSFVNPVRGLHCYIPCPNCSGQARINFAAYDGKLSIFCYKVDCFRYEE